MIHNYSKRLAWGADEVFLSTVDYSSGGGWYYRPGEDKKTFGRGDPGRDEALRWMDSQLRAVFNEHFWRTPTEIDNPIKPQVPEARNCPSLHAGYVHPVFGYVEVSLYFDGRREDCLYQLKCHALAAVIALQRPIEHKSSWQAFQSTWTFQRRIAGLEWAYGAFLKDPLNEAFMGSKDWWRLQTVLEPPKEFKHLDFFGHVQETREPREGVFSYSYRNADLIADPEKIKAAIIQGLPELQRCFDALGFLGYRIEPTLRTRLKTTKNPDKWQKNYDGNPVSDKREAILEELEIKLPRSASPPYEEPHSITFSDRGIGLTCGYHQAVSLYNQYQQIQDQRLVDEVLGVTRETTIEKIKGDT